MESVARDVKPKWRPGGDIPARLTGGTCVPYGLKEWGDLFTPRQLTALTTFTDLVGEVHQLVERDVAEANKIVGNAGGNQPQLDARVYADAMMLYLAFAVDKSSVYSSSLCYWLNQPKNEIVSNTFARQAFAMMWDYAEANPFSDSGGNLEKQIGYISEAIGQSLSSGTSRGIAMQLDAAQQAISLDKLVSTDPPYYDNIGYADLSDFFYVWLRRTLKPLFPELFATLATPKAEELIAARYRHGDKGSAEAFFLGGMTQAMHKLAEHAHPAFPVTIYYAFRQSEAETKGSISTGWETFLNAVISAGFSVTGTWPLRTERPTALKATTNALASSIVLVCRPRSMDTVGSTRREFVNALKAELPAALKHLQRGNIAPVDLAQAAIGPGMAVFTRYSKVLDAEGRSLSVRDALALINATLDEVLAEQEGDFDADSRWALAWFEQLSFSEGEYGMAETLSKAKNTSVSGMVEAGIVATRRGKVRLLKPSELHAEWDPTTDPRLTAWEVVHQLIRSLETSGEGAAAALVAKLGSKAEIARELAYRLYALCERKKRAAEALSYNGLVQSWPEILRLAEEDASPQPAQAQLI
jgi:putative DNA methylase